MSALPPVRKSFVVPLGQAAAFDLFLRRLPEWWPIGRQSVSNNAVSCHVEPTVGGRLYEKTRDGGEADWGVFRIVDDPHRVVFTWHPGLPPTAATEIEVTFTALPEGTRVDLEHRNWERLGVRASTMRTLFDNGWVGVLACYAALAGGSQAAESHAP